MKLLKLLLCLMIFFIGCKTAAMAERTNAEQIHKDVNKHFELLKNCTPGYTPFDLRIIGEQNNKCEVVASGGTTMKDEASGQTKVFGKCAIPMEVLPEYVQHTKLITDYMYGYKRYSDNEIKASADKISEMTFKYCN